MNQSEHARAYSFAVTAELVINFLKGLEPGGPRAFKVVENAIPRDAKFTQMEVERDCIVIHFESSTPSNHDVRWPSPLLTVCQLHYELLIKAIVSGVARVEPWSDSRQCEICFDGLRYVLSVDENGILNELSGRMISHLKETLNRWERKNGSTI